MSLEHIPKIDFAGVVTDTFDAGRAGINASEYSTSAQNQSLINTLVEIIAVYISDNIATDKNCLIHLSKVLYDANYKLLYKLSQDENFIDKLRQKLVITDSSASSKPALTSVDFDRMKNTIVNQVKAAIKDAVKKNKTETNRQINDVAKAFNADKNKPATSPSKVKISETTPDNATPEQNEVETNDGTIDFNKLEPILPNTQLTPVWLTSRSVITNNLRKLNINASNRTIALLTVAFKKTTVQAAIDTLTGAIDKNAKAIHRTSAAALTATTVGATAGSVIGRAHKPSVFSKNSSFALGAKSALTKVGSVATSFFKGLFTVTKHIIVGLYKITKTILVSIAKLTKAVLVTVGRAIKFTFVTLPMKVFSDVKRIGKFINEKVLNTSIVKGIVGFLLSPAIVYIVGFIAGFIAEKIKQAGGVRELLSNFFTGVKNRIVEGIKTAIDVVWAGIKKPGEVITGLKDKLKAKIKEKLKKTEDESVENPDNQKDSPLATLTKFLRDPNNTVKELKPLEKIKAIAVETRAYIKAKADEDRAKSSDKAKHISVWIFLDVVCNAIENAIGIINSLWTGIKTVSNTIFEKTKEIVNTITDPFKDEFNKKLEAKLGKKLSEASDEEKNQAAKELAESENFLNGYFSEHNPFSLDKFKDLYAANAIHNVSVENFTKAKNAILDKIKPILTICNWVFKIANTWFGQFLINSFAELAKQPWILNIPDPIAKIVVAMVYLAIRGIMSAFEERHENQFFLGKNFEAEFGISVDEAADKAIKTKDLKIKRLQSKENGLLNFITSNGLIDTLNSNELITDESKNVTGINAEQLSLRIESVIENLTYDQTRLDKLVNIFDSDQNKLNFYIKDNSKNLLPKDLVNDVLTFPLIGITEQLTSNRLDSTNISMYNRTIIHMLNVKRAIIKKLLADIIGTKPSSITAFEDLIKFTSTSYLTSFKKHFISALDTQTGNLLYKYEHFNLDTLKEKLTNIYTDTTVDVTDSLKPTTFTHALAKRNVGLSFDDAQKLNGGILLPNEAINAANLIKESANDLSKIANMSGIGISEKDRATIDETISKIGDATTEGTFSAMGLENDEAYLIDSKSDVIRAILTEAGLSKDVIASIMNHVKQDETLNKTLVDELILSNKTMEETTKILKRKESESKLYEQIRRNEARERLLNSTRGASIL